jgi:hypothetical protein
MGVWFQGVFGLMEAAQTADGLRLGQERAAAADTRIEAAQAELTGIHQGTTGMFTSMIGAYWNMTGASNSPANVERRFTEEIGRMRALDDTSNRMWTAGQMQARFDARGNQLDSDMLKELGPIQQKLYENSQRRGELQEQIGRGKQMVWDWGKEDNTGVDLAFVVGGPAVAGAVGGGYRQLTDEGTLQAYRSQIQALNKEDVQYQQQIQQVNQKFGLSRQMLSEQHLARLDATTTPLESRATQDAAFRHAQQLEQLQTQRDDPQRLPQLMQEQQAEAYARQVTQHREDSDQRLMAQMEQRVLQSQLRNDPRGVGLEQIEKAHQAELIEAERLSGPRKSEAINEANERAAARTQVFERDYAEAHSLRVGTLQDEKAVFGLMAQNQDRTAEVTGLEQGAIRQAQAARAQGEEKDVRGAILERGVAQLQALQAQWKREQNSGQGVEMEAGTFAPGTGTNEDEMKETLERGFESLRGAITELQNALTSGAY